ncbi:hypothetical protein DIPPA_57584 [Diplonema papillatum]|nr:hypothetical protein DIPPA_57584 [Diplonema papillatum]
MEKDGALGHLQRGKRRKYLEGKSRSALYSGSIREKRRAQPEVELFDLMCEGGDAAVVEEFIFYGILPANVVCAWGKILTDYTVSGSLRWPNWDCKCKKRGVSGAVLFGTALAEVDTTHVADKTKFRTCKLHIRKVLAKLVGFAHGTTQACCNNLSGMQFSYTVIN